MRQLGLRSCRSRVRRAAAAVWKLAAAGQDKRGLSSGVWLTSHCNYSSQLPATEPPLKATSIGAAPRFSRLNGLHTDEPLQEWGNLRC
ncbi:hypothetical protein ZWY2020_009897 [Hordeum vulgare]|nr:hypothetical protein ZWY2020_009897 [Hordeum vulgare]